MTALTSSQQDGLNQIVDLMETHTLSPGDVKKAAAERRKIQKETAGGTQLTKSELVMRLFTYLGGTLIFAGLGVFIHTIWDDIGSLPRVIITFGSGFTAYLCAIVFASDKRFEKAATPANIVAFLLQPVGLFVLLKEYFHGNDVALGSMIVFGPLALQQALTFIKFRSPALLLFALLYLIGFAGAFVEYAHIDRGFASLVFGLFLFLLSCDMQVRNKFKDLTPIFFFIGSGLLLSGVYYYVGRTVFDPAALSIILAMLGFSVIKGSKTLYVLSCLYVAAYFCGGPGGGGWETWGFYKELTAILTGGSLMFAGQWLRKSSYISLYPLWMFLGAIYALGGFYAMVHATMFETLFVAVAAASIYGALLLQSRAVLAAAVISLISFVVEYTAEHFAHTVGWPLLLIFIGFVVLGAGFLFARLAGRIKQSATA